ncbi:MAG TPA: hypothetical protein VMM79_16780 [Longimicrobiales bacterium]|nr:hypothetical protein [Longimicrobiales bacterium]
MSRDPAIGPVPTEEELYRLAETEPAQALAAYRAATRIVSGDRLFREAVLTRAATFSTDPAARVTIMQIVADAYPASISTRFGLGEAYAGAGRTADAVATFETALGLVEGLPQDQRAAWRQRIEAALADVGRSRTSGSHRTPGLATVLPAVAPGPNRNT